MDRAYIAIDGGIDVPLVLGSHSTNLKLGIGGAEGSKLYNGEVLTDIRNRLGV